MTESRVALQAQVIQHLRGTFAAARFLRNKGWPLHQAASLLSRRAQ